MISALQSALSGLQAFGTKFQSNSNNIANSLTEGYKRTQVNLSNMEPGGVKAEVTQSQNSGPLLYQETSFGLELIEQSNVDLGKEIPDMMLNTNFYKANLKTIQTDQDMFKSVLDLKA